MRRRLTLSFFFVGVLLGALLVFPGSSTAASTTDSKGGYKACPAGSKIRVHVAYRLPYVPTDAKVVLRIYESPSRSSANDIQRTFDGQTDWSDTWVVGRIRVGYWKVRSYPGTYIVADDTYARCT